MDKETAALEKPPDGWRLVPNEATEEMLDAVTKNYKQSPTRPDKWREFYRRQWRTLLAAAPAVLGPVERQVRAPHPERDAVLRELQDRTNQTWLVKRKRWALLVLRQSEEIERLQEKADLWDAINILWNFQGKTLEEVMRMRAAELAEDAQQFEPPPTVHLYP